MTPDPAGLAAVDLSNPQSLNRYAYALNNPLKYIDPRGCPTLVFLDQKRMWVPHPCPSLARVGIRKSDV